MTLVPNKRELQIRDDTIIQLQNQLEATKRALAQCMSERIGLAERLRITTLECDYSRKELTKYENALEKFRIAVGDYTALDSEAITKMCEQEDDEDYNGPTSDT